jgi:hypothetical protein
MPVAAGDVFPPGRPAAHNVAVTYGQMGTVCPQCGNTDAVHSIQELATLARARLGQGPAGPQPGTPAQPQPGTPAQPGWAAEPQAGWAAEPQAGPLPGPGGRQSSYQPRSYSSGDTSFDSGAIGDDIAGAVLGAAAGAAAKFLGRQIGRRMQDRLTQQVLPAMAGKQQTMLQAQIAIAERHPDLCACLNDHVIFLTGGSRTLPMPNLGTVTVEQADALVASLRDG